MGLRAMVYLALAGFGALFSGAWLRQMVAARRQGAGGNDPATDVGRPTVSQTAIGLVTDFFDFLGIGSFATTTSIFRLLRIVPDHLIPGTLLVGHTLPTFAQAIISIKIIAVDMQTLVLLIAAAVAGSWLGGGVVSRLPKRKIQLGMGTALLGAAAVMFVRLLGDPEGGAALGLSGTRLAIGMAGNFVLGALMNIGIGAYAPSLIMFGLLGMDTKSIFPIMMGSCAFLMPVGGIQFVRRGSYSVRAALGLTLGGVPGVLLAAKLVEELSLVTLKWIVLAVVVYTAVAMLRAALRGKDSDTAPAAPPEAH